MFAYPLSTFRCYCGPLLSRLLLLICIASVYHELYIGRSRAPPDPLVDYIRHVFSMFKISLSLIILCLCVLGLYLILGLFNTRLYLFANIVIISKLAKCSTTSLLGTVNRRWWLKRIVVHPYKLVSADQKFVCWILQNISIFLFIDFMCYYCWPFIWYNRVIIPSHVLGNVSHGARQSYTNLISSSSSCTKLNKSKQSWRRESYYSSEIKHKDHNTKAAFKLR